MADLSQVSNALWQVSNTVPGFNLAMYLCFMVKVLRPGRCWDLFL